ncbi:MAG: undecaprenyl-diphosphate phosphatase [Deltaproteobacteria bacterium]|nr:undecaprenyl-diphosphate phosphatase [Deltaproteobacteria bacterium]
MSSLESIVLGIIQGVTEFLPVSSSGHLVLFQSLFGLEEPQLFFDIVLHGGTLLAVILVYWDDIRSIAEDLFCYLADRARRKAGPGFLGRPGCRFALWIVVGTVPAGLVGLTFGKRIEPLFASPLLVGVALLVTGSVLWLTACFRGRGREVPEMGFWDAVWIGVSQGLALLPGISRSGMTVSAGLLRGLDRELSARFSFLLVIPATLGALLLAFVPHGGSGAPAPVHLFLGGGVAFVTGYGSLRLLLGMIRGGRFYRFAYYCWAAGVAALILSLVG